MSKKDNELYEFGSFRLDVAERKLERLAGGRTSGTLRDKAFDVLVHLVRNNGRLTTKDELLSIAWPETIVEEVNLSKAIHAIRQFLGDGSGKQKYIETVPKHGYRFVANVRKAGVIDSQDGAVRESSDKLSTVGEPISESREPTLPRMIGIIALVIIGLLGFGVLLVANNWRSTQDATAINQPHNSKAYDLYIRGKVKAGIENREETEAAIKLLTEAVQLDPGMAEAHAQLARVYNTMAFKYAGEVERKQFSENAEVAIAKALELNPNLAEAQFARGLILWTSAKRFPHEQAIRAYRRSLELDPSQDEAHQQLSMVYAHIGLMEEANRSLQKALELNPNNTMARYRVANYLVWQGKSAEALAVLKTVPSEVSPLLVERMTAEALIQTGQLSEAEDIVDAYLSKNPVDEGGSFTGLKALLLARSGKFDEAEATIERAVAIGKGFGHFHHTAYNIASAYAAMNNPDAAVDWLQNAADDGFPNFTYFEIDPNLDRLRVNPEFVGLMTKLQDQRERFRGLLRSSVDGRQSWDQMIKAPGNSRGLSLCAFIKL